jgi:hypothetical protein
VKHRESCSLAERLAEAKRGLDLEQTPNLLLTPRIFVRLSIPVAHSKHSSYSPVGTCLLTIHVGHLRFVFLGHAEFVGSPICPLQVPFNLDRPPVLPLTLFAIELPSIFNRIVDCLFDATPSP